MTDWWRGAVVYQIYPRSYQDDSGDGIGDLAGITRRLDHIAGLGCDAIWLSPIFTSPMADMGYDVADYTDIDPLFGTLADFDRLVTRAHDLGLKVIIDQVISHTSDQHPWFVESRASTDNPRADWYVWADPNDDGSPPNNWPSVFGGSAWEWDARRRQYYLHNFLTQQPDLNFHCQAVQDTMLGTMRFWLERGVDGFRLDTVNYYFHDQRLRANPPAPPTKDGRPPVNPYDMQAHRYSKTRPENIGFLKRLRSLLDEFDARAAVGEVGEALNAIKIMADYTRGTDRLQMAYSFDMLSDDFTVRHFRDCIEGFFIGAPDGWPWWSFSNHDVNRHTTRWAKHAESTDAVARQAIAMLIGFEGTIGLYQGEELGQTETVLSYEELTDPPGLKFWPENKGRDGCRTPMVWEAAAPNAGFSTAAPWLPVKPPQAARAVDTQAKTPGSVLSAYREALAFRRQSAILRQGRTRFVSAGEPVLAFHRTLGDRALTCIYNLSPKPVSRSLSAAVTPVGPSQAVTLTKGRLELGPNGFGFFETAADAVPELH